MEGSMFLKTLRQVLEGLHTSEVCKHGYKPNTCPWPPGECNYAHKEDVVLIDPTMINLPPPPPGVDPKIVFPSVLFERQRDSMGKWSWKVREVVKPGPAH
jgi:hypothetical protein